MVSVSNVSSGQAANYYNKDNYYSKEQGQGQGQWQGKGAEELGLSGDVTKEQFENLINGRGPNGERLVDGSKANRDKHRAATDVTFSAPKSVSILNEVAGDKRVQDAHDRAVAATLDYIEKNYPQARQSSGGVTERVDTGNIIVAKFGHNNSRELDPNTHTHGVIMNATERPDGKWRALSNEEIYRQKMLEGQYYRNELARNLKELGYGITSDDKGLFEVAGVPEELIKEFSRRKEQIDAKVKELKESGKYQGVNDSKLREIACLDSRKTKKDVDMEVVRESWKERAAAKGYTPERIQKEALEAGRAAREQESLSQIDNPKWNEYDYVRQATKIRTESESTFTKDDVLKTAGKLSCGEQRIADLDRAYEELKKDKEIVYIRETRDKQGGRTEHYSTPEMQKIENDNIHYAKDGQGKSEQIMTPEQARASIDRYQAEQNKTLTDGQKAAAEHIATANDKVTGIQGDAGTGKTTMLDAVREMAEKEGYQVRGFAPTGKAAEEMEAAAKIRSKTIDSFLNEKDSTVNQERLEQINKNYNEQMQKAEGFDSTKGKASYQESVRENAAIAKEKLQDSTTALDENKKQLWIIDEASMVDSKKLNQIFERAKEAQEAEVKVKIVVMGDTKQLQAIQAGKAYQDLQEAGAIRTVRMDENIRQKGSPEYQQAMRDFADKKIDKSLDRLEKNGHIHEIKDHDERVKAIVDDYTSRKDYKSTIIVTDRNDDRREMNEQIREKLKEEGKLKGPEHTYTVRENKNLSPEDKHYAQKYEVGDIVTAKSGMGKNGNEARVIARDEQNHTITTKDKDDHKYTVDLKKDGDKLDAYKEREASFCKGDKVVCGKNDEGMKLKNGHTAEIKTIDADGNMSLKMANGKVQDINIRGYQYVSEGYAVSVHKSQGQTAPTPEGKAIYHGDTEKGVNQNGAYVGMTRGKKSVDVYTNDKQEFREQVKVPQEKSTTIDHSKEAAKGAPEREPVKETENKPATDKGNTWANETKEQRASDTPEADKGKDNSTEQKETTNKITQDKAEQTQGKFSPEMMEQGKSTQEKWQETTVKDADKVNDTGKRKEPEQLEEHQSNKVTDKSQTARVEPVSDKRAEPAQTQKNRDVSIEHKETMPALSDKAKRVERTDIDGKTKPAEADKSTLGKEVPAKEAQESVPNNKIAQDDPERGKETPQKGKGKEETGKDMGKAQGSEKDNRPEQTQGKEANQKEAGEKAAGQETSNTGKAHEPEQPKQLEKKEVPDHFKGESTPRTDKTPQLEQTETAEVDHVKVDRQMAKEQGQRISEQQPDGHDMDGGKSETDRAEASKSHGKDSSKTAEAEPLKERTVSGKTVESETDKSQDRDTAGHQTREMDNPAPSKSQASKVSSEVQNQTSRQVQKSGTEKSDPSPKQGQDVHGKDGKADTTKVQDESQSGKSVGSGTGNSQDWDTGNGKSQQSETSKLQEVKQTETANPQAGTDKEVETGKSDSLKSEGQENSKSQELSSGKVQESASGKSQESVTSKLQNQEKDSPSPAKSQDQGSSKSPNQEPGKSQKGESGKSQDRGGLER